MTDISKVQNQYELLKSRLSLTHSEMKELQKECLGNIKKLKIKKLTALTDACGRYSATKYEMNCIERDYPGIGHECD